MDKYMCLEGFHKNVTQSFLKLPKEIYLLKDSPQDIKTEKQILSNKHVLSGNFSVYPFVVIEKDTKEIMCRCLLTYYANDPVAYLGFFEAKPNHKAVKEMLLHVERKVKNDGKKKILGPINSSIYIGYRFKTNNFDKTYTGEPYNKPYYKDMWEKNGFISNAKYVSNKLRKVRQEDLDPKLERIYQRYLDKGYQFISPTNETFQKCLRDVYGLMMESYSGFTGFKSVTETQFLELFSGLQKIANYDMMKLAYKDGKIHAFAIALPNYGDLTLGKLTIFKLIKMLKIKKNPEEYVILYVGADKTAGIGSAIMHHLRDLLYQNQCTSITALIKEGNLTGKVYSDLYMDTFEYELFEKNI